MQLKYKQTRKTAAGAAPQWKLLSTIMVSPLCGSVPSVCLAAVFALLAGRREDTLQLQHARSQKTSQIWLEQRSQLSDCDLLAVTGAGVKHP
jgi:hypothetical protein